MALSRPKVMLIDLDGTLVDSVPDLAWCIDQTMQALAMPICGVDKVRKWVGNGAPRLIERALTNDIDGVPTRALYEKAYPIFIDFYAKNPCNLSELYPSVKTGLTWLKGQGISLGCVTNKDEKFTLPILEQFGILNDFDIVISGDTLPVKKPDPAPLLYGAKFFDVRSEDAMMLGDSINDVKAARAAGFSVICTSYGYNHGIDIRTSNPDKVIDSFAELIGLF